MKETVDAAVDDSVMATRDVAAPELVPGNAITIVWHKGSTTFALALTVAVSVILVLSLAGLASAALIATGSGLTALVAAAALLWGQPRLASGRSTRPIMGETAQIVALLDKTLSQPFSRGNKTTGVFALEIDHYKSLAERHDHDSRARLLQICAERIAATTRRSDLLARMEGPCFIVGMVPSDDIGLESAIQFAARLQSALSAPVRLQGQSVYPSFSVGFALSDRAEVASAEALIQGAICAMVEAQRSGPGGVRSFSNTMRDRIASRQQLARDVVGALDNGDIRPFFQPQIETATGKLTGFETLARWHHPERGIIPPNEFLPALEEAGLMGRLGEVMVREALAAIMHWDAAGLTVPQVGVNFSTQELSDPDLADRISAILSQNDLSPGRLTVEVLETVVAGQGDDVVTRNLAKLAAMGCRLDLDDFGTGHASITAIRRFSIGRIKIDRSFVTRIDEDREQQDMLAAILTMSERLGLEALAEGVETDAELAMLRDLGCTFVQGFGIARPMPLSETDDWISQRARRTAQPIELRARSA